MSLSPSELVFDHYDPADEARRESLMALGNGMLLVRASAPWASVEGTHYSGTYRAGCYDPLDQEVNGERLDCEVLVNLPNWLPLTFRIEGEAAWFSLDDAEILEYRHRLNMIAGIVTRDIDLRDRCGRRMRLIEHRLVSMARPELAALSLEVRPEGWSGRVEIRSAIDGGVVNAKVARFRPLDGRHLDILSTEAGADGLLLRARSRRSGTGIAVATRTRLAGGTVVARWTAEDCTVVEEHLLCEVGPETGLVVEKLAAIIIGTDMAAMDAASAAREAIRAAPDFPALREAHAKAWCRLQDGVILAAERPDLDRALRLGAFHLLQTVSPQAMPLGAGVPARGWQEAYHGQIFWDEIFVLPFLGLRFPDLARSLLLYRCRRLDTARAAARQHGLRGAMFPWRSATTGREETPKLQLNPLSGRWMPDHTRLQRHIGAAIAYNIWHYVLATGDEAFLAEHGAAVIIEVARFWASLARFDPLSGRWRIRGVVGPDEYHGAYPGAASPGIDDNAYTNVMAAWTLFRAQDVLDRLPAAQREIIRDDLGLGTEEPALWDRVARGLRLAFHENGVLAQFDGFDRLEPLDLQAMAEAHPGQRVDWVLEARSETADAYQAVKQADVVMLLHLLPGRELEEVLGRMGYHLGADQLRHTAAWYLARTTHDSSLSRIIWAGALARLDPDASWCLFQEAMHPERDPSNASAAADGVHLGAMGGIYDVLQRHYLGFRVREDAIMLDPAPPAALGHVRLDLHCRFGAFRLAWSGSILTLRSNAENRGAVTVIHPGGTVLLSAGEEISVIPG
ncbi:glycoside hydrolase family 65 protein [Belnapia sp. T6]|uniref:Glycoside hydrolase family 65 protein n=1 Tax=Belnapia mucosa TaxID=2804532 RepID=A0ABS1V0Q4_9PROT|nr:glycoside hydrolase family 65 protein [Belnapia mucosa]MBL6455276.1 glycoside hydrolase family 65 protein [Belnapia mucosa]